jgi:patatin-like phospholipase/acyl hydrolase
MAAVGIGHMTDRVLKRVLSIDGGGIRGLVPALVLAEIERQTGKPISSLFDLIAGTSTGGILALGLTCPGNDGNRKYAAADLVELYKNKGHEIFPSQFLGGVKQLFGPKYSAHGIETILRSYFGETRLKDVITNVFVPAYEIQRRDPFFFRSSRAREDPAFDFPLWAVARATSAAPTYFAPAEVTSQGGESWVNVDGGLYANNPSIWAMADVLAEGVPLDNILVASLATASKKSKHPFLLKDARGWGLLGWARPVIDIALTGGSDATEFTLAQLLGERHFRLLPTTPAANEALDDVDAENIGRLVEQGEHLIADQGAAIANLCTALTGDVD